MTRRRTLGAALVLAFVAAGSPAVTHTGGSTGLAAIAIDGASIRYRLTLWPSTLPPSLAEELRLARDGSAASGDRLLGFIRDKVSVTAQGARCTGGAGSVVPPAPSVASVTLVVTFACPAPVRELGIRDDLFDVFGADYHTIARIDGPGRSEQLAFGTEMREARLTVGGTRGGRGLVSFVALGIEHILTGYDHLLFLLALLLHGGGLWAMAKIVTAFTLAHSVTLTLAVLDVVVLPDRLVEAVIALSIAAVAAENLFLQPTVTRRFMVSFCFGLVHGFGFSSALRELGLPADGLVSALLGFNGGVELGQAAAVAVALPVLGLVRSAGWEKRMVWGSSTAILLVGVVLFVERALL